jgi:hypothetical protein
MALYVKGQQGDSHKGDWLNKNEFRIQFFLLNSSYASYQKGDSQGDSQDADAGRGLIPQRNTNVKPPVHSPRGWAIHANQEPNDLFSLFFEAANNVFRSPDGWLSKRSRVSD